MTDSVELAGESDSGHVSFDRRVNLWLSKFASAHSAKSYADALGFPHKYRTFQHARPTDTEGTFRRGAAFFTWCAARGLDPLSTVGLEQMQQWLRDVEATGLAKRTRAHMLTAVREFYTAMQRQGAVSTNPAALVDSRTAGLAGLSEDDDQLYLDAAQTRQLLTLARRGSGRGQDLYRERDLALLLVLAVTGARASEVTGLRLADFRRPNPTSKATLRLHGKGHKIRTADLDPHVADDVEAWIARRADLLGGRHVPAHTDQAPTGDQWLFCTRTGKRLSTAQLGKILRTIASRDGSPLAGIADELHPHALRGAFVTNALDAGIPIDEVGAAAGHAHLSTTWRYDRRRKKRKTGAFRAVSGLVAEDHRDDDPDTNDAETQVATRLDGQTAVPGYDAE